MWKLFKVEMRIIRGMMRILVKSSGAESVRQEAVLYEEF